MVNGKLSSEDYIKLLNKRGGGNIAIKAEDVNSEVDEWIPTGATWLDAIICQGKLGGIPIGRVSELAGLPSAGKSYMAAQIAKNAQKMGIKVFYFDSEGALSKKFLDDIGVDTSSSDALVSVKALSVESVLANIEQIMSMGDEKKLFIWDSLAFTPAESDIEGDYNPQSSIAVKARILAKGMSKIVQPLQDSSCTLLVLNQLKDNITSNVAEAMTTPYVTPGGKALNYAYSLRIWLTGRKGKATFVKDENDFVVGSEVSAKLQKSRFGTQNRICNFKIIWGDDSNLGIRDEESIIGALKQRGIIKTSGAWHTVKYDDGTEEKFQASPFADQLRKDPVKREKVLKLFYRETIEKFDKREGNASEHYEESDDGE